MEIDKMAIVEAITKKGYSIKELAHIANISEPTINRILHHRINSTLTTVSKISKALDVPASELIKD